MASQASDPLSRFAVAYSEATGLDEASSRAQAFSPTGYPAKLQVAPGLVMSKADKFDYAPDIEVADRKIRMLKSVANAGKLAVLNITIEPGSGKTLFLPFKFVESNCLVVLPTVFDAWAAKAANSALCNIEVYGVSTSHNSHVTYTDSYHAAYMMTTGEISKYHMVFVDESHSQEGITLFMASVARPGQVYVRMTASPATVNARAKKSFPIVEEHDVPNLGDLKAAAQYVQGRPERRVLVLTPSPTDAQELAARVPRSRSLTMFSPTAQIVECMEDQTTEAIIIADGVCGKGVNLNVDCVVDFAQVVTPNGLRHITSVEQLQRKARTGRSKPGVYCCSFVSTASRVMDNYSIFRSNLWFAINGLVLDPCTYSPPDTGRLSMLLAATVEPALIPESPDTPVEPVPVTPIMANDDASDSGDTVSTAATTSVPAIDYDNLILDDDADTHSPREREFTTPSWYSFYMEKHNHPDTYVADLVYSHRSITAKAVLVNNGLVLQKAPNRKKIAFGENLPMGSYTMSRTDRSNSGSDSASFAAPNTKSRVQGALRVTADSTAGVKYGSAGYDLSAYNPNPNPRSGYRPGTMAAALPDVPFDGIHLGGPLAVLRGTKVSTRSRGVGYKAASICGGYLTVSGVVLASGSDLHPGLVAMSSGARDSLYQATGTDRAVNASHYMTWVVTLPLDSVNLQAELNAIKASGAWSVPPNNVVPTIDLDTDYHPSWVQIVSDRIRNKVALPPIIPRRDVSEGYRRRRVKDSSDLIGSALEMCSYPCYSAEEMRVVYKAWNAVAVRTASITTPPAELFLDAQTLLTYMSSADRMLDF